MSSTMNLIESDPILSAMAKGDIPWGDLLLDEQPPILTTRKDIWTKFPVKLIPLGSGEDGAERHAVMWNTTRFADNETRKRLFASLNASKKWRVEQSFRSDCICVIRMVFQGSQSKSPNTLADLHKLFPAVTYSLGGNMYSVELHENRVKKLSDLQGYDVTSEVSYRLLQSLKQSSSWRVLPSILPCEVCRIQAL